MKKIIFLLAAILCFSLTLSAKDKVSTQYRNVLVLAYSQVNSVYEDENLKLEIYDEKLWATNKTHKTIFIDLSQCFLVHNGSSHPMFTQDQDEKKASKKGVSTSVEEFISIAPSTGASQNETFICNMATGIYGRYTTSESPNGDFSDYDKRFIEMISSMVEESQNADPKGKAYIGTVLRHFTEDESVNNIGVSIAYAFNKRADDWTSVSISTWVSDVIFSSYYVEMPQDLKKKEKRGFSVKETKPAIIHIKANTPFEFNEEKSPLVVCDWEGNFKRGYFQLFPTYISRTKGMAGLFLAPLTAGVSGLFFKQDVYKRSIYFDGSDADWGKMTYMPNGITSTKQTK